MAKPRACQQCGARYRHYHGPDGRPLPSVTEILKVINKPALVGWAFKEARTRTLDAARGAYAALHEPQCLGIDTASFVAAIDKVAPRSTYQLPTDAVDIGTLVHQRVEAEIRRELGQDVDVPEIPQYEVAGGRRKLHPAWAAYQAYLDWRREHEVRPVEVERRLYSMEIGFAGTTDFTGYVDGKFTVADWKTSKAVYAEYRLQIAAYRAALLELEPALVSPEVGGLVLRFPKDPDDTFEAHEVAWADQAELMEVFNAALRLWRWQENE